ncbi:ABC transporter permease [Nonomuraea sp. NBC_01738]|uniref:ABC transporter permease n=1 Tax=Nonomuraea sp. NBC_01738 TaxID=2976003 RepID=UPI002E105F97|nr:ABC transporter permease [Nonomuraea sp. NBC_01738]
MKKILLTELKLHLREWPALLFVIGLPLGLLLGLGSIPGFGEPDPKTGGESVTTTHLPAMMVILALMTLAFSVLPAVLAAYRERGVLRRMSTTPVHPGKLLTAQLLINLALGVISLFVLVVMGRIVLGITMPKDPLGFVLVFVLGTAALLAMGLVIAAVSRTGKIAQGLGSLIMFPLMFVAGMWIPRELMPSFLRTISDYSVAGPFATALRDTWGGSSPQLLHLIVMVVGLVVFGGLAVRLFRWE